MLSAQGCAIRQQMLVHSTAKNRQYAEQWLSSRHLIAASCMLVTGQALVIARLGSGKQGPLFSEVIQLALGLICILACTAAFRRSSGIARYAWRLLAVSFVVWAVAQVLGVYIDISGDHSLDSADDILFFLSVIPFGLLPFLDLDAEPNSFDRLHIFDFVQVCIFWVSIFLCFSPRMWSPATAFRIGPLIWSRYIAFDGLLVATFVVRALLSKSRAVRSLFGRMAAFLILSGLADSYALNPGHDLPPGGWFDLIWSALLVIPILIAATWKSAEEGKSDGSASSQRVVVNQVFPLLYPLVSFLILILLHRAYPLLSLMVFALAFITFALRVVVIQHRQGRSTAAMLQSELEYRLLFDSNPLPMWVFERKTLKFLAVNEAACRQYGFSGREFLTMTIADIRPEEELPALSEALAKPIRGLQEATIWRHRKKNGAIIHVEIIGHDLEFDGIEAELVAARDISDRKRSEEMLQNSENKYRALFEESADANWLMDEKGFLDCNSAALQMFGYPAGAQMMHPADISPPNQPDGTSSRVAAEEKIASAFRKGTERFEWLHQRKNNSVFPAEVCLTALTLSGQPRLFATVRDITDRKHAEEALLFKTALLEAQTETTIDGILVVDESDHIVLANTQFRLQLGIPEELIRSNEDHVVLNYLKDTLEDPDAFLKRVKYLYGHRNEKSRDEFALKNGKIFDRYTAPLVDSRGQYRGRIWYFRDITDRKVAEQRVQYLAYYDDLTGLANRTLLQDRMAKAVADARRQEDNVALLFLDLDGFKDINDSLGHSIGDLLLQGVAERLKTWGREQDTIARLGGDEFLIMLTRVRGVPDAAVAAERLMDVIDDAFVIQGHSLHVSCSLGISIFPENGQDVETLIKNADAAMYSAKQSGRNNFRFFTEDLNTQAVERLTLENNLRSALAREQLFLMYQPQIDVVTGRITGLEALVRWQHPDLGLIPPDKFIRIAENSGLILPIGEWVLRTACSQAKKWQDAGFPAVSVAINVSAVQFRQEDFCGLVKKVLRETGLPPQYLELELTESLFLTNASLILSVVQQLRDLGVTLAIDDFGTGYSNFSYLRRFRIGKLKIDRSLIQDIAVNPDDAAITTAIISMAKSLHLKVIAEGVEDEAQMSFLREHQCDEIQGYYFSKPLTVDKVADKLRGQSRKTQARASAGGTHS